MAKKYPFKKQIRNGKKENILWITIGVLFILLASSILYIIKTSSNDAARVTNFDRPQLTSAEEAVMQAQVNDIEQRRYRYPVIDVKENRVYIPEKRMFVPLTENSRDIRYQIWGETVWLSTAMAVGRQTGDADASCDKVVIVTDTEERARGYIASGTIKTIDGGTRYIFRHPPCKIYPDTLSQNLADVAKGIQYY